MDRRFKKIFSVLFAILIGTGIILFAWESGLVTSNKISSDPTISGGSWKDSLLVVPQASSTKTLGVALGINDEVATTTSSIIVRELLVNYALFAKDRATTTLGDTDIQTIIQSLMEKTPAGTGLKHYTKGDLRIVETSTSTVESYKKETVQAIETFSKTNKADELVIVSEALSSKDPSRLEPLALAVSNYQRLVSALLYAKIPASAVLLHLRIIQAYATILSGIEDMQQIIVDPARGISGLGKYHKGIDMLTQP